jgi:hypothetical protein
MPPVYATISFFSYRYFRSYTYYALVEAIYEALAVAAFLMLLIQFVGVNTKEQKEIIASKQKLKMPIPFCCWRYRPSKPYFMYTLKVGVIVPKLRAVLNTIYSGLFYNIAYCGP